MDIIDSYNNIMMQEKKMFCLETDSAVSYDIVSYDSLSMLDTAYRLLQIARNSTVLRSGNIAGRLTHDDIAYESDGGHTNLVQATLNYALDYHYGIGIGTPRYSRREISEAVLIHDLPENITGDIADNRQRDEQQKMKIERQFIQDFMLRYDPEYDVLCKHVQELLLEMNNKSTEEGCLLYMADKLSAITMMLCYDEIGVFPSIMPNDPSIAMRAQSEVDACARQFDGTILLSELWTIDYLFGRKLCHYDDSGFFTALLVMQTLLVHKKWYDWRKFQYVI